MNQKRIYLDNAATTLLKPNTVATAVANAICGLGNAGRGGYPSSLDASRILYETRNMLSELFQGEGGDTVAFTANATHALNIAIKGSLQENDHVITTAMEHNSVLRPLYEMEEKGIELTILPCDERGRISLSDLGKEIRDNTKAVVCTHASNVTGNVNDIKAIGRICRDNNLIFILDASQSGGVVPIQMQDWGIDVVCFTGHKGLMGPQGTGGLCVRKGLNIRPLYSGGTGVHSFSKLHTQTMPAIFEAGTLNVHGIAGLHASLTFLRETKLCAIREKEKQLADSFYQGVKKIAGVTCYGDFDGERVGIVSLNIGDYDSALVSDELAQEFGIETRSGAHCAPLMHQSFQTIKQGMVRFSFGYFNTESEVETAIEAIRQLADNECSG